MIDLLLVAIATLAQYVTCQDGSVLVPGELLIGGLVPIHTHEPKNLVQCGKINERFGIQRLEAMLFAIDNINKDDSILRNISLGLEVFDTCSSETIALDRALKFVKRRISVREQHVTGDPVMAGVIGPAFSSISVQVAHLFRLFQIPQVSFDSTSYELSDKKRFEFFSRTVPHDLYQAKALVDIAKFMNWSYVSVVYSDDTYGTMGFQAVKEEASKAGICIAVAEKVEIQSAKGVFGGIIDKLLSEPQAKTVVVFSSQERQIVHLLQAAKDKGQSGEFQWLGTDAWGNVLWLKGLEEVALNTITVSPKAVELKGFREHFYELHPKQNIRNPWFKEFWERHFNCSIAKETNGDCSQLNLTLSNNPLDNQVANAMDAVYVFAHALDAVQKDKCPDTQTVCERMRNISGREILEYIRRVSFIGVSGNPIHFNADGDVKGRFDVFMLIKRGNQYADIQIGEWDQKLSLKPNLAPELKATVSSCRPICKSNEVKIAVFGKETCCWTCRLCNGNHYLVNDTACEQCPLGYTPTPNGRACTKIDIMYFGKDLKFALPAAGFAGLGIVTTLFVIAVLIKFDKTPLVKACGRELSHMLLVGILLAFSVTFVAVLKPNNAACVARFFASGVCFSVCYASLFIKTNRISRIFNRKNLAKRPILILPFSQFVLVAAVVSVQILLLLMLSLLRTPKAKFFYPTASSVYLDCSTSKLDFGLSQVYNFILIFMCTIYAFKTRKIPSNFNEAKYIAFAMYSSCVVWLAFLAVYYMEEALDQRPLILCTSVSLIAFILLGCLYAPKVYVILFRPHRNVRKHVNPSLSLSSSSKDKGHKPAHAYVGVGHNAEHEQEGLHGSSAEYSMERKRMSSDCCSAALMEENHLPSKKQEMEKLIKQLRRELTSTKESLRMTQDRLLRRPINDFCWEELKESKGKQDCEKIHGNRQASSGL